MEKIDQCHSTNSLLLERRTEGVLWTDYQTAGRGQAGNGWESEKGKNILLSVGVANPPVAVDQQWRMSMLFSLVVWETIAALTDETKLTVKWPNDIYYDDRKLAGILIEHCLKGQKIAYSVLGIGLNVNQQEWKGTAPNPVSLLQITGQEWDREKIVEDLWQRWQAGLPLLQDEPKLKALYMAHLYRRKGLFPFVEREVNTTPTMNASSGTEGQFMASIEDVSPTGELILRDDRGTIRKYHFKQIRYVVNTDGK